MTNLAASVAVITWLGAQAMATAAPEVETSPPPGPSRGFTTMFTIGYGEHREWTRGAEVSGIALRTSLAVAWHLGQQLSLGPQISSSRLLAWHVNGLQLGAPETDAVVSLGLGPVLIWRRRPNGDAFRFVGAGGAQR